MSGMKPRQFVGIGVLLLLCSVAIAQVSTSSITGQVEDATGALVSGASITVTNEDTGVTYTIKSSSAGTYAVSSVPPGNYTVTVSRAGFSTFTSTKNVLLV